MRRGPVELAISTGGLAPALAGLLREALDAILPHDLERWIVVATAARARVEARSRPDGASAGRCCCARSSGSTARRCSVSGFVSLVGAGPGDLELLTLQGVAPAARSRSRALRRAGRDRAARARAAGEAVLRRQARRSPLDRSRRHPRADDPRGEARRARRAPQVRRSVRARSRRRRSARARSRRRRVRGRARRVSSAIAAPALAGIPVTHRGLSAGFAVLSGHAESAFGAALDSLAPARSRSSC